MQNPEEVTHNACVINYVLLCCSSKDERLKIASEKDENSASELEVVVNENVEVENIFEIVKQEVIAILN